MIHIPGKIPIFIHPSFWVFAALIGFLYAGGQLLMTFVWIGIIFVSLLFHEFGHALMALFFGRAPRIELVALGGLTYHDGDRLPFWKQFLITLNGPVFGLLLAFGARLLIPALQPVGLWREVFILTYTINLIWTLLNVIPVLPLDGGQLMRIVLEAFLGVRGVRYALILSMALAALICIAAFLLQQFFIGSFFFLFGFQAYDSYRRSRLIKTHDERPSLKQAFQQAEQTLQKGQKELAADLFEKIRHEAKEGLFFVLASQYLAVLNHERGNALKAYELLLPLKDQLSDEGLSLLHQLAFCQENYPLVVQLSGSCFLKWRDPKIAVRNASACARLQLVEPAVGWLQTAYQEGIENLEMIISEQAFDAIRSDARFQAFLSYLKSNG